MEYLAAILNSPWSLTIILIAAAVAQRMGLDVAGIAKKLFNGNSNGHKKSLEDIVDQMKHLFGEQQSLKEHYNHKTTGKLDKIEETSEKTLQILNEFKEYGIHIRKD